MCNTCFQEKSYFSRGNMIGSGLEGFLLYVYMDSSCDNTVIL